MGKSGYVIITTPNLIVKVSVSPEQEGEGVPPSEGAALLFHLQIETFLNILCICLEGFLHLKELLCSFTLLPFFNVALASLKSVKISLACSE